MRRSSQGNPLDSLKRIHESCALDEDWLVYIQLVRQQGELRCGADAAASADALGHVFTKALANIEPNGTSEAFAHIVVQAAQFKSRLSDPNAETLFDQARSISKKFAFVHIAAAQFELDRGNREKCQQLLQNAKVVGAEPSADVALACCNLNLGYNVLLPACGSSPSSQAEGSHQVALLPAQRMPLATTFFGSGALTGNISASSSASDICQPTAPLSVLIPNSALRDLTNVSRSSDFMADVSSMTKMKSVMACTDLFKRRPVTASHRGMGGIKISPPQPLSSVPGSSGFVSREPLPMADADHVTGCASLHSANQGHVAAGPRRVSQGSYGAHAFSTSLRRESNHSEHLSLSELVVTSRQTSSSALPATSGGSDLRLACASTSASFVTTATAVPVIDASAGLPRSMLKRDAAGSSTSLTATSSMASSTLHVAGIKSTPRIVRNSGVSTAPTAVHALPRRIPAGTVQEVELSSEEEDDSEFATPYQQQNGCCVITEDSLPGCEKIVVHGKTYFVLNVVGRGGSSQVRRVYEPRDKVLYAVKTVSLAGQPEQALTYLANEINILERLQVYNTRIVKMADYEYNRTTNELHIVLECGDTDLATLFKNRLKDEEHISPLFVKSLWVDMLKAVAVLHKEGIIHSDLKPANFLLVAGRVKLIDFGIANELETDASCVVLEAALGTFNFMAPEVLNPEQQQQQPSDGSRGERGVSDEGCGAKKQYKVGTYADVWSLGCILYYATYGRTPFQHITNAALKMAAIISPSHTIEFPQVNDPDLLDTLKSCLVRNPRQRPSIEQLLLHPYANVAAPPVGVNDTAVNSALLSADSWDLPAVDRAIARLEAVRKKKSANVPK